MNGIAGLLDQTGKTNDPGPLPAVMIGEVVDITPLRVTLAALDGRLRAHTVYGTLPDAAAGDTVRVMHDEDGGLVVVAWEPA